MIVAISLKFEGLRKSLRRWGWRIDLQSAWPKLQNFIQLQAVCVCVCLWKHGSSLLQVSPLWVQPLNLHCVPVGTSTLKAWSVRICLKFPSFSSWKTQGPEGHPPAALLKRLTSGPASTKHGQSNENCLHCSAAPLLLKAETVRKNCCNPTPFQLLAKGWALCPMCWCPTKHCRAQIVLRGTAVS